MRDKYATIEPIVISAILTAMHKRFFARCLVAWMIGWLPLAGAMASTMSIPNLAQSDVSQQAAAVEKQMPCHQADDDSAPAGSCSQCLVCHTASALPPMVMPLPPLSSPYDIEWAINAVSFTSFIPELLPRPPSPAGI